MTLASRSGSGPDSSRAVSLVTAGLSCRGFWEILASVGQGTHDPLDTELALVEILRTYRHPLHQCWAVPGWDDHGQGLPLLRLARTFAVLGRLAAERRPDNCLDPCPQARSCRADRHLLDEDRYLGDRLCGTPGRPGETCPDLDGLPIGDRVTGSAFHVCQVISTIQDYRYERVPLRRYQ